MASGSHPKYRVKYMHEKQIEREVDLLLAEWANQGNEIVAPIPLDELVEIHLKLQFEIEDLRSRFGGHDVLGAIWFNDGTIRIQAPTRTVAIHIPGTNTLLIEGVWVQNDMDGATASGSACGSGSSSGSGNSAAGP